MSVFSKVTAFVTRTNRDVRELLTFVHPLAGRQVPAGSVEVGEDPRTAAIREVWEETGVRGFLEIVPISVSRIVGTERGIMACSQPVRTSPTEPAGSSPADIMRRGYPVEIEEERDAWVRASHRVYDFSGSSRLLLGVTSGWVPRESVATTLLRHHFHLVARPDPRPATWNRQADGHVFSVEWLPLDPAPTLAPEQQPWLDECRGALLRHSVAGP